MCFRDEFLVKTTNSVGYPKLSKSARKGLMKWVPTSMEKKHANSTVP